MQAVVRGPKARPEGVDYLARAVDLMKLYNTTNERTFLVQVCVPNRHEHTCVNERLPQTRVCVCVCVMVQKNRECCIN